MSTETPKIRAIHVHDAANVGRNLVDAANEMGQSWSATGIPWYYRRQWTGILRHPVLRTRPVLWDFTLAAKSARHDVVHLHTGGLSPHMRWLRAPWVLHFHGTDVRSRQYDGWASKLEYGVQHADAVFYSTPDLQPHVHRLPLRNEPMYFPIPIDLARAPRWKPTPNRVIFSSRWEGVKGGKSQIEVAQRIRRAAPQAELLGLDWGDGGREARNAGVTLLPKMPYETYKEWLATASVVVGQMTSILATSELEALSIGVPLVSSASPSFYPELNHLSDQTVEGVAHAAVVALTDPERASRRQQGERFIEQKHDARVGVNQLLRVYGKILSATS